jgi:hypothetical protein
MSVATKILDRFARFVPQVHSCGLASNYIAKLSTKRSFGDGYTAVAVSKSTVDLIFLAFPTNHRDWRVVESREYTDAASFETLLDSLTSEPTAPIWGE